MENRNQERNALMRGGDMMDGSYTVIAVDGHAVDAWVPETMSVRYDRLSWEEATQLMRLSFTQGFECILWKTPDGGACDGTIEGS